MPETLVEKQTCSKCDVDVRENTSFCYNCGNPIAASPANGRDAEVDSETQAALDDLAEKFKIDEDEDDRLAKAAAERRKARVTNRKTTQYVWEPSEEDSGRFFVLIAVAIAVVAALAVFFAVVWR